MNRLDGLTVVVGGGALGLLLAAHLGLSESAVRLVTRTERQAEQVQGEGITVADGLQTWTVPVSATADWGALQDATRVVLAVKTHHLPGILSRWPVYLKHVAVLSIQNGLKAPGLLVDYFGERPVVTAVTRLGARRTGPHSVVQAGHGLTIIGAGHPDGLPSAQAWAELWGRTGLPVSVVGDIRPALWSKAAINAAINPLAALLGLTNGALRQEQSWHWLMRAVVEEVRQAAAAEGILLESDLFAEVLATLTETASNRCSMLEDLTAGRPTELEAITGEVIRRGLETGVAMPANEGLYQLMRARTVRHPTD